MEWTAVGRKLKEIDKQIEKDITIFNFKRFNLYSIYRTRVAYSLFNKEPNIILNEKMQSVSASDIELNLLTVNQNSFKNIPALKSVCRIAAPQIDSNIENTYSSNLINIFKREGINFKKIYVNKNSKIKSNELEEHYVYLDSKKLSPFKLVFLFLKDLLSIVFHLSFSLRISRKLNISIKSVVGAFTKFYISYLKYKIIYSKLERNNVCFLFASYGNEGEIMAIKENGLKVSEYQHGILYSNHFGYNFDKCLIDIKDKLLIPSKMYLYDEWTKKSLLSNSFYDKNQLSVVGNYKLNKKTLVQEPLSNDLKLCIFSQIGYFDNANLSSKRLNSLLLNLGYQLDSIKSINIKLHPREKKIPNNLKNTIKNINISEESYTDLIHNSDIILTCSPSIFYESIALNKNVLYEDFQVSLNGTNMLINDTDCGSFAYNMNKL